MKELEKNELIEVDGGCPICFLPVLIATVAEFWAGVEAGWSDNKR